MIDNKKSTGLGVIKHLIERLQPKGVLGNIFRKAIRKFLSLNQFEYEIFLNPRAEEILGEAYQKRKLFPLVPIEELEKLDELSIVAIVTRELVSQTFNEASDFKIGIVKLLNMNQDSLLDFAGPIYLSLEENKEDKEVRLDRDPLFSKYHSWAARNVIAHPGTDGIDG